MAFGNMLYLNRDPSRKIELTRVLCRMTPGMTSAEAMTVMKCTIKAVNIAYPTNGTLSFYDFMDLLCIARGLFIENDIRQAITQMAKSRIDPCRANVIYILLNEHLDHTGHPYVGEPHPSFDY